MFLNGTAQTSLKIGFCCNILITTIKMRSDYVKMVLFTTF